MHPLGGVRRPDRDPVAGLDARRDQRARPTVTAASASSREGEPVALVDERLERRELARRRARRSPGMVWGRVGLSGIDCIRYSREGSVGMAESRRSITDEGVARLRARIGVPEPHPLPPHYTLPTHRHVPQRRGRVRRRQPALVRSRLRREDPLGGRDRAAAARRRRHADRRGRGHRGRARAARPDEGRSAARRARVLRGERARVVGAAVPACGACSAATRSSPRSTSRASSRAGRCTSGPRRCSATSTGTLLSGQYRLMVRTEREKAREKKKYDAVELAAVHRRADRRDRGAVRARARRAAPSRAGGRTWTRATRSARW